MIQNTDSEKAFSIYSGLYKRVTVHQKYRSHRTSQVTQKTFRPGWRLGDRSRIEAGKGGTWRERRERSEKSQKREEPVTNR